ncbi:MAG TPA: cyclic peptide export ABC transporter [Thermoanaerobaculia bacterium]|jgi:putative ATP-binding cassette transporter|nr:cyclic peptide export ABC transporter [Thermoanaerobaculia bacterium]
MLLLLRVFKFVLVLSREVRGSRPLLWLVVVAGLLSGIATTGLIALINRVLTGPGGPGAGLTGINLTYAFVGLCFGLPLLRFGSTALLVNLTQKTLYQMRLVWCRQILAVPIRQLEQLGPHRVLASLTNDLGAITEALLMVPQIVMHFGVLVTCLLYLGWLSPLLLGFLLCFMVLGLVSYQIPLAKAFSIGRRSRELWDVLVGQIQAVTHGAKELKMHRGRREAMLDRQIEPTARMLKRLITVGTYVWSAASSWGQVLFFVAIGLLLFVVPAHRPMPTSVLLGYSVTLIAMMTPLEGILAGIPRLTTASIAIHKIDELGLSLGAAAVERDADPAAVPTSWRRLELAGVEHTYKSEASGEMFALGPVDLSFTPGELVFLIGGNGSGKTTLAKLLLGLYTPERGELRLDGEAITDANRDAFRQLFAVVFSDFYLFDTLLGLDNANLDAEALRYLRELQLDRKVKIEQGELSTVDLSQGQRKRLALLTAYLEDRPIYLFDEWAADQDPTFKEVFYREILPALKARGKTVFVISHDDHYYDTADRIVKLDYGRVESDRRKVPAPMAVA